MPAKKPYNYRVVNSHKGKFKQDRRELNPKAREKMSGVQKGKDIGGSARDLYENRGPKFREESKRNPERKLGKAYVLKKK